MNKVYKNIYNEIKKYKKIYVVRHIGPDPDAICTQLALKESIKETFPSKEVFALGASVAKFKNFGTIDKVQELDKEALVIAVDVPDKKRIDGLNVEEFKHVIKIDHHPFIERYGYIEHVKDKATSAAQLVLELINNTRLRMTKSIAENLFTGIVADSNRFMFYPTDPGVFRMIADLVEKNKLDIQKLYADLYSRPLSDVRLMGYIAENLKVTKNGFAYIELDDDIISSFNADIASASNMINDFNNINEIYVWIFISKDVVNNLYKINIRSRGPVINEVAMKYSGGGHKFASGVRTLEKAVVETLIKDLDELCKEYKNTIEN